MAQPGARRHRLLAAAQPVVRGDHHRNLGGQTDPLAAGRVRRVVSRLRVVRGERGHRRAQHVHGVRVLHRADDIVDRLREQARFLERPVEGLELAPGGKLAVQQQIGGLLEGGVGGEIVDRVGRGSEAPRPGHR